MELFGNIMDIFGNMMGKIIKRLPAWPLGRKSNFRGLTSLLCSNSDLQPNKFECLFSWLMEEKVDISALPKDMFAITPDLLPTDDKHK